MRRNSNLILMLLVFLPATAVLIWLGEKVLREGPLSLGGPSTSRGVWFPAAGLVPLAIAWAAFGYVIALELRDRVLQGRRKKKHAERGA